jgi:hypothetical protein
MKIIKITLLFIFLGFFGYAQTPAQKTELIRMMARMLKNKPDVNKPDEYLEKKIAPYSKKEVEKSITLFQNSFYFESSEAADDKLEISADAFHLAKYKNVIPKIEFTKVLDNAGNNLIDTGRTNTVNKNSSFNRMISSSFSTFLKDGSSPEKAVAIKGKMEVSYPTDYHTILFNASETGQTKTYADLSFTLLSVKNNTATIKYNHPANEEPDFLLKGLNDKGQELKSNGSGNGLALVYEALNEQGELDPAKEKMLLSKLSAPLDSMIKNPNYYPKDPELLESVAYIKVHGSIQSLQIDIPGKLITKELDINVLPAVSFDEDLPKITRSRYQENPGGEFKSLTKEELINSVKIRSARSEAMIGLNVPEVIVPLPKYTNSLYAKVEFSNVKVYKAGKLVRFSPQGPFLDEEKLISEYRMERTAGNTDLPLLYDQVTGNVKIKYPLKISTRKIYPNKTDTAQVKFRNAYSVAFVSEDTDEMPPNVILSMQAYDLENLSLYHNTNNSRYENEYKIYDYWGKVAYVEVDEVTEWTEINLPFKLTPAPLLKTKSSFEDFVK